jgi:hypothetical protein
MMRTMIDGVTGFRRVLHEWAARQLSEKSSHAGPFEIAHVEMEQTSGSSISDSETWVIIRFRHDGRGCPDSEKVYYTGSGRVMRERCEQTSWFMPDTKQTIDMLNELLAIADEENT